MLQNFELASDKSQRFPVSQMKSFISDLHAQHQHYVMIIDAAIHKVDPKNKTDIYDVYSRGHELDTFMKNANGSGTFLPAVVLVCRSLTGSASTEYIGRVWPGYTVFPDWFAKNTDKWWQESFANFSKNQVDFDGCVPDLPQLPSP